MYITASTYGGIDWHDSRTRNEQLKYNNSYNIGKEAVPEVIADDIAKDFPYVENIRENILQALSQKTCFQFAIKTKETDSEGKTTYKDCESCEMNGQTYLEQEAVFDGNELTLSRDYAYGQVSYITSYYVEDIPDDQLGFIVTEDFLAPVKGIPLVQRLYHDIFDDQDTAQNYAKNLKLHDLQYPKSIVTFLVCNRQKTSLQPWYQSEMDAIKLMEEKGQTYLDDSFCIFTKSHIENLKKLSTKETA